MRERLAKRGGIEGDSGRERLKRNGEAEETDRQTDRDRQTHRQTDRQIDGQTQRDQNSELYNPRLRF